TQPASYHLQQNAKGIQIQPLLQDLFGFHSFSGSGDAVIDIKTTGNDRAQMIQALNGSLLLDITNGAWHGIDMDSILKNGISSEKIDNSNLKTPFHHFTLNSEIEKGISHHINTELFSDSLHVVSSGYTDLNTQKLSENLLISNVLQPKNKPIPLKIGGTVQNPSITLDYSRLTNGMNTPAEKQKALQETIQEQWKWLKPR
ncbi:AsmA family protein, partial [Neisseria sp. P0021.S005]